MKILDWFNGKKTYLGMITLGVLGLLRASGIEIPDQWFVVVGAATGVAMRHAQAKAQKAAAGAEDAIQRRKSVSADYN